MGCLPLFFQTKGFALFLERRYNRVGKSKDLEPDNLDLTHGSNTFNSLICVSYLTSLYLSLFRYKMEIIKLSVLQDSFESLEYVIIHICIYQYTDR